MKNTAKDKLLIKILKDVERFYALTPPKQFVPFNSKIPYSGRVYDQQELVNLVDASLEFWLTSGRYTQQFETEFARSLGVKYCLLTNSGSSANLLAVSALTSPLLKDRQLKPKDEIITVACAFPTTINPIIQNGLIPVFVDIDLGTYNINVQQLKKAVSKKTKAIFIAHTLGNPFDLNMVRKIAQDNGLWLIEDNCDALGSKYKDKFTGTFGHIATSSFYPPHHITMGEGGAVLTNDPVLKKIILSLRDWGRDCWCDTGCDNTCGKRFSRQYGKLPFGYDHKYVYSHIGYNLKATDLQAAIGVAQLKKLPDFIKARRANFDFLYQGFRRYEKYFLLPRWLPQAQPSWFGLPVLVKKNNKFSRNDIVNFLESNNIATRMLFAGNMTKHPAYDNVKYRIVGKLTNTDAVMNDLFWIGVYPGLTKQMLEFMVLMLDKFMASK